MLVIELFYFLRITVMILLKPKKIIMVVENILLHQTDILLNAMFRRKKIFRMRTA